MDILALLQCLAPVLSVTTLRQLSRISFALLAMTGRVTRLGLSRWADTGGSYRTVQRWFYTTLPWLQVFVRFPQVRTFRFRQHLFRAGAVYLLAGDEVVVTKAGKQTFGLDRFFSSLLQKPVPAIAFFALSLVSTTEREAFPPSLEQVIRTEAEKAARKAKAQAKQAPSPPRPPGRPKGSKNRNKAQVTLTPELQHIQAMLQALLRVLTAWLPLTYLARDGHFGNHHALPMTRQCGLHGPRTRVPGLISKLRSDAALYWPPTGPQAQRGPHRKYGPKVDYRTLPEQNLKQVRVKDGIETRVYPATRLHPEFSQPLKVVILVQLNLRTQAWAHVILFSSDLELAWDKLVDYYSLRFQIEFNFRDAKQYWGLEDFMNITETAVTNAANLSLFMVNLTRCLRQQLRPDDADFGVLDLSEIPI
jgi:putative transposase